MMKIFYSLSLAVSVFFGTVVIHFHETVLSTRFAVQFAEDYDTVDKLGSMAEIITKQAGVLTIGFMVFYALLYGISLGYLRRKTARVISIIGLSLSGLVFLLTLLPITKPSHISYDEFAPVHFIYLVIMVAFGIVNMVQAIRNNAGKENDFILDDLR